MFKDIVLSTLHTDSPFFALLGDDKNKIAFFKAFIAMMRKKEPDFGRDAMSTLLRFRMISMTIRSTPCAAMESVHLRL